MRKYGWMSWATPQDADRSPLGIEEIRRTYPNHEDAATKAKLTTKPPETHHRARVATLSVTAGETAILKHCFSRIP